MRYQWLLDNGHGGVKDGVYTTCPSYDPNDPDTFHKMHVHPNGLTVFEGEFNRMVVDLISYKLNKLGINNVILTPECEDISLKERVVRANNYYRRNNASILVSIHGNAFNTNAKGLEVFTSIGDTPSDPIAEVFIEEAEKMFPEKTIRVDLSDGDKDKEANFFVLRKTSCPAILTENFFFDHFYDAKFMMSNEGIEKIAQYHVNAIVKWENTSK